MTIDTLVADMLEFKGKYPTLSIEQVLKIFEINSIDKLAHQINNLRLSIGR